MNRIDVSSVFDAALSNVCSKLISTSVHRVEQRQSDNCVYVLIFTKGYWESSIYCAFSYPLYEKIITEMYGGELPPEDERSLYIKEFVNILCGRAISMINDLLQESSRLSIPFCDEEIPKDEQQLSEKAQLCYKTDYGDMYFEICYNDVVFKEGEKNGKC